MKHDDAHEAKQNKALETALDALIDHVSADASAKPEVIEKLKAARAMLDADDAG